MTKNTSSNKESTKELSSNVTIVGSKLILSLPNAQMPVVWQADLDQAQSSSFTLQEDKKAKAFTLVSKNQDDVVNEIANFSDKQVAVDILMDISNVLQNAHAQIKINTASSDGKTISAHKKQDNKIGAIIAVSLVAILVIIWVISASNNLNTVKNSSNNVSNISASGSSGVAISADDFLNNR